MARQVDAATTPQAQSSPAAPQSGGDLASVVAGVQRLYQGIETLGFSFAQETRLELLDRVVAKKGTMVFKRPGRFLIHYETPPLKDYISNGSKLWIVMPDEDKVYEESLKRDELDEQAKLFLDGLGNLSESFLVSALPERQKKDAMMVARPGIAHLQLVPKKDSSFFTWIALAVDTSTFRVVEMTLFNRSENISHYSFSQFQINHAVDDGQFVWKKSSKQQLEK